MIDPTKSEAPEDGKIGGESDVPAGTYMLALTWIKERESSQGNRYWRCRYEIVAGPLKGSSFFSILSMNTEHPASLAQWVAWSRSVGMKKPFDEGSERDLREHFFGRAFKAKVTRDRRKGREGESYWQNKITQYIYETSVEEDDAAERFKQEFDLREERRTSNADDWQSGAGMEPADAGTPADVLADDDSDIPF